MLDKNERKKLAMESLIYLLKRSKVKTEQIVCVISLLIQENIEEDFIMHVVNLKTIPTEEEILDIAIKMILENDSKMKNVSIEE